MSEEATFLFADLAGYTALTEAHGDERAADLAEAFCERVCSIESEHGGSDVKTLGDAVMSRIPDAGEAIRLGVRIVDEIGRSHGFPGRASRHAPWPGRASRGRLVRLNGEPRVKGGCCR